MRPLRVSRAMFGFYMVYSIYKEMCMLPVPGAVSTKLSLLTQQHMADDCMRSPTLLLTSERYSIERKTELPLFATYLLPT